MAVRAVYSPRLWPAATRAAHAEGAHGVVHDEAQHVGGQLGVLGAAQLVGVGVEEQGGHVTPAGLRRGGHEGPRGVVDPGPAHAGLLGALAGEREGEHRRSDRPLAAGRCTIRQVPPG